MTFNNLRIGNQVYILHKDNIPKLEIGKVVSVTPFNMYTPTVDITIEVNGNQTNFQKLPINNEIADFGNNIVIACSKESITQELNTIKSHSQALLNSIQLHKDIIANIDTILIQLNPEIQERQRQEEENKALREEVNSLKEMFKEFMKTWQQ